MPVQRPRPRVVAVAAAVTPVVLVALLVGGWALDTTVHAGQTIRNVELLDHAVGGLGDADLFDALAEVDEELAEIDVVISTPHGDLETTAGAIGLELDQKATALALRDVGRDGSMLTRPFRWFGAMFGPHQGEADYTVRPAALAAGLDELVEANAVPVVEPSIALVDGEIRALPGEPGEGLDLTDVAQRLEAAAETGGLPLRLEVEAIDVPPTIADDVAEELAVEANDLTDEPLVLQVGDVTDEVAPATLRTWLRSEVAGERLVLAPVEDAIAEDLEGLFGEIETEPTPATFDVVDRDGVPVPIVVDGTPGQVCCDAEASRLVFDALVSGQHLVEVGLGEARHEHDRAWAESLGIVELVGEFTTQHKCCEGRVENIHRIADLTRGMLIEPGETFSINERVGRRTRENGFVPAGSIVNGVFEDSVGGGISQYATTLFNAAFFAGLDYGEYQSHSIYISRYPYGREATVSYPRPELEIVNSTDHTVLVWPTYTATSITVQLFSTKTVSGEQTGQTTSRQGVCTRVTTERTRTWIDGRTETDTVFAVYRPSEGVNCSGASSTPPPPPAPPAPSTPPTTATPTTAPPTTAPPPPPPPPTTAAP